MSSEKLLLVLLVFYIAASAAEAEAAAVENPHQVAAGGSQNDLEVGKREPGDFLVHRDYFFREPAPKRIVAFRPFDVPDQYSITQVRAIDQTKGQGGVVTYEYGGPGMTRILLGFHSRVNQGIEYAIELYGKLYKN